MGPKGFYKARIEVSPPTRRIFLWGINIGGVNFPKSLAKVTPTLEDLNSEYVCPETLYLDHSSPIAVEILEEESSRLAIRESPEGIELKKCSYDGRHLPLDSTSPGLLAFHKHNAKRTGHQNECRACKKWRINDSFNPLRTVDQLHESSLITRERKMFLREPEILQRIKDRHGEGLKSLIWRKFNKRCFRCQRKLQQLEVEIDHTRPLAYLWPVDIHATCLCSKCNNLKKDKFPVDAYNEVQLRKLSRITGLSLKELVKKDVNEKELRRVLKNIELFATTWNSRTFKATARKIQEVRPDVDLFERLKIASPTAYKNLVENLDQRPDQEPSEGETEPSTLLDFIKKRN